MVSTKCDVTNWPGRCNTGRYRQDDEARHEPPDGSSATSRLVSSRCIPLHICRWWRDKYVALVSILAWPFNRLSMKAPVIQSTAPVFFWREWSMHSGLGRRTGKVFMSIDCIVSSKLPIELTWIYVDHFLLEEHAIHTFLSTSNSAPAMSIALICDQSQ